MAQNEKMTVPKMDVAALYREEMFTDRKVGTIQQLTPVRADGTPDPARKTLFVGQIQLLTAMGSLPLSFEIPAASLKDATERFPEAAQTAVDRTMKELQELRREAASSIVIPEKVPGGRFGGPGGMPGGGMPGGGKIQFP